MRILVGISHPKQVYMFKNLIHEMTNDGHKIEVVVNEKEMTSYLLKKFNISFKVIGENQPDVKMKLLNLPLLIHRTFKIAKSFRPDIFIGQALPHLAYTSILLNKPFIVFEDTEQSRKLHRFVMPFINSIITPSCFQGNLGQKQIRINGYFELAYLHPNNFSPNPAVLRTLGINEEDKFVIMRFVSRHVHHDIGHKGVSLETKIKAVKLFSKYAKVYISSEIDLPDQLKKYQIRIPKENMQDFLYFASLLYGESATMATECAVLGTPAIYVDKNGRSYTDEVEMKYGLVFNYNETVREQDLSIEKGLLLLSGNKPKEYWQKKSKDLLSEKIDVAKFMVWFVENYPKSHLIMKENPDYQLDFR